MGREIGDQEPQRLQHELTIEGDASARVALDREPAQCGDGHVKALGGHCILHVDRDSTPNSDLGQPAL